MWFVYVGYDMRGNLIAEKWTDDYVRATINGEERKCLGRVHLDETWAQASISLLVDKHPPQDVIPNYPATPVADTP